MVSDTNIILDKDDVIRYIKDNLTRDLDLDVIDEILDLEVCYLETNNLI